MLSIFFVVFICQMKERGAFRILNDTYVTEESGTGVVHQAPYFGEVRFISSEQKY